MPAKEESRNKRARKTEHTPSRDLDLKGRAIVKITRGESPRLIFDHSWSVLEVTMITRGTLHEQPG
jgi:hypothetical protein